MGSLLRSCIALCLALALASASLPAAAATTTVLTPAASASIRSIPGFGIFELAPVGDMIQSTYFKTTAQNREVRRGFFEFSIPACGDVQSATLTMDSSGGWTSFQMPPDTHELAYHLDADLAITLDDYARGTVFATFDTDVNVDPEVSTVDVASLVEAAAGGTLGFSVKLAQEATLDHDGFAGEGFRVSLTIECGTTTIADITADVDALVASGALGSGNATALSASLSGAAASIAAGNMNAARNKLEAFISKVEAFVRSGTLDEATGDALIADARAILASLTP